MLQINYGTRTLERVYQLHSAAINCMLVSEGLCVTGSDDKYLRVWPLDFSDFLLEVSVSTYQITAYCGHQCYLLSYTWHLPVQVSGMSGHVYTMAALGLCLYCLYIGSQAQHETARHTLPGVTTLTQPQSAWVACKTRSTMSVISWLQC